ncbi:MAG: oligoribonuclease [Myxococcaceae bacterium]|nr:oligoribonuclease [Myxococcaceae bacterium]MBH2006457.1 oligoribonuclease [Myxococcaceae bacterium]
MNARTNYTPSERWVWIDLEMTGLNERQCVILQAAMVITDPFLNEVAHYEATLWQPESALLEMVPIVREMHTKNGLLKKVRESLLSLKQVEQQLMKVLSEHVAFQKGYLAGNSIYMDRCFLRAYMPMVEAYLNYRQLDVSSIKLIANEWYKLKAPKKPSTHTALADIRQSIEELRFFKDHCFKPL